MQDTVRICKLRCCWDNQWTCWKTLVLTEVAMVSVAQPGDQVGVAQPGARASRPDGHAAALSASSGELVGLCCFVRDATLCNPRSARFRKLWGLFPLPVPPFRGGVDSPSQIRVLFPGLSLSCRRVGAPAPGTVAGLSEPCSPASLLPKADVQTDQAPSASGGVTHGSCERAALPPLATM